MADDDSVRISVVSLKEKYPNLTVMEDDHLESNVQKLQGLRITKISGLEFASRPFLEKHGIDSFFLEIVKPDERPVKPRAVDPNPFQQIHQKPLPKLREPPPENIPGAAAAAPAVLSAGVDGSEAKNAEEETETRPKRNRDEEENGGEGNKRPKYWQSRKMPVAVESPTKFWYLGDKDAELFLRQCTLECFDIMWNKVNELKEWPGPRRVAFIVSGAPGIGKSWSVNTIVWCLEIHRQNIWLHSASKRTLTTITFEEGKDDPIVSSRPEEDVKHYDPPEGTWFLYDSVGGSASGDSFIPFKGQRAGIPCVVFSSPKDTNYRLGIQDMQTGPGGGHVVTLWTPPYEWEELKAVMPSLYKETRSGKNARNPMEFEEHIRGLYLLWGGVPRRFNKYLATFLEEGKESALAMSRQEFNTAISNLSASLIENGPRVVHANLDIVCQSAESAKSSNKTAPPSWLLVPVPVVDIEKPFRNKCYKFCSQQAELTFLDHLEKRNVDAVRNFCKEVFAVPGVNGIGFERFAHFVLTRTELNMFRWTPYNDAARDSPVELAYSPVKLPKCKSKKCDMKDDLTKFQELIANAILDDQNVVIDPESDQQDAIDMFAVVKLENEWRVLAMQDTISQTQSFHPVKILEYMASAKAAFEGAGQATVSNDFFQHVVVVPHQERVAKPFRLEKVSMATKIPDVASVRAKFTAIALDIPSTLDSWNVTKATQVCNTAQLSGRSKLKGPEKETAGAQILLLQEAEKKVKSLTWVLDGLL